MPLAPIVSFWDKEANLQLSSWEVGVIRSTGESGVLELRIWNNKGGSDIATDMQEVSLTIVDGMNQKAEQVARHGWLKAKCTSLGQASFVGIGAEEEVGGPISDDVQASYIDVGSSDFVGTDNEATISGQPNSGGDADTSNFAEIELYFDPIDASRYLNGTLDTQGNPVIATHGVKDFKLRIDYFYV